MPGAPGEAADVLALAAIDGQHGFQTEQRALLARRLTVGRAVAVAVLRSDGDALAVQNGLHLLRMSRRMDAAVEHLVLSQIFVLAGLDLLDLGKKIAGVPHFLRGVHQTGAHLFIGLVGESRTYAGALLHQHGMSGVFDGCHLDRGADHAVFAFLDVLENSENHTCFLLYRFSVR